MIQVTEKLFKYLSIRSSQKNFASRVLQLPFGARFAPDVEYEGRLRTDATIRQGAAMVIHNGRRGRAAIGAGIDISRLAET